MRFSWTFRHSAIALAMAILALQGQGDATAQFAAGGAQNQPHQQYQRQQQYQQQPYVYGQTPQAPPQYTAVAYQPAPAGSGASNLPLQPQPAVPGQSNGVVSSAQPGMTSAYESYPGPGCTSGNCGVGGNGYTAYNTFVNSGAGNYGAGNCGTNYGVLQGVNQNCGRRWFGGVYGLLMERDGGNRIPLAFSTTTSGVGYYPTNTEVVLTTSDVDLGYQGGAEIRFGSTLNRFGRGATYGAGNCGVGCGPQYAWEAAYWGLAEESETSVFNDAATFGTDGNRLYGMIDFRGLEYNGGGGYRSVNDYYDYGPPTTDNTAGGDVEIRSMVARSTFSAQNVELNLLRLPVLTGGSCWSGCNSGGGGGECDAGGCATGYGVGRGVGRLGRGRPAAYSGPRYSLTTLVGLRYMRFDEDFYLRSNFVVDPTGTPTTGFLAYNVEADNDLIGFQLGCNGIYRFGCTGRFAVHCNSALGLYGNHISVNQRMDVPTGGALRFANGANPNFDVRSSKNDVAMLGELRLGGSYQAGTNWRLYGGWRVIGVTGIALSTNQIPTAFITPDQVGTIASNGSMLLHGLQVGTEWTY